MRWIVRILLQKVQEIIFLGMVVSLGFGLANFWHAWRNSTPTVVSLMQNAPGDLPKHLTLKNVTLATAEAVRTKDMDRGTLYVPIRARGARPDEKIHLLLKSSKADLKALAKSAEQTEITGMVESDFNVSNRLQSSLKKSLPNLHREFVIINEGETPSMRRGFWLLALSVGLFVVLGVSAFLNPPKKSEPPVLKPAEPPPLEPQR